jgi:hypothetical protein
MSAPEQQPTSRSRWRAPAIGAVTGLAVAAAIVVPSAIAAGGQGLRPCVAGKSARAVASSLAGASKLADASAGKPAPAPGGVPHQFIDGIAQLQQAGTISAAQARTLDAAIESGRIDPDKLVADGVVSAAQMKAVNDKLIPIKMSLAAAAHAGSSGGQPAP